ncbi:MAG: hypothetical protein HYZ44_15350 [Bacteroidetes bacterium]|nr:hypothetical protein [Bacteroidota bacterium]
MDKHEIEAIRLHSAGATVRHSSPFEDLKSFKNDVELSQEFLTTWVSPYYRMIGQTDQEWIDRLISIKKEITIDVIQKNLGDFNWRTRQTGAFFAAITNQIQLIDVIGTHLLKSEVCYAGDTYCHVLASFNLPKCVEYINLYLDYYLQKPDLWFDQKSAMEAILYLDKLNGTHHFDRHQPNWMEFIKNKTNWKKEITTSHLEKQLYVIQTVRDHRF